MKFKMTSTKFVIILSVVFALFLAFFNIYNISYDKTESREYTPEKIESMEIEKVNINTADAEVISGLKGISDTVAQNVVDYREEHGDFEDIEEIKNVKGIGDKIFNSIKIMITVE